MHATIFTQDSGMVGRVIFSHGFESGPDATKTTAMGEAAAHLGWTVVHADYRDLDGMGLDGCVQPRCDRLLKLVQDESAPVLLVGSSMGAFVSGRVSLQAACAGLFLLATPVSKADGEHPFDMAAGVPVTMVHGFADDLCPALDVVEFARRRGARLLLVADGHRLSEHVEWIVRQFQLYLQELEAGNASCA